MQQELIIIGAGPAGLAAAYLLSQSGHKVLVLEARNRIGGRAYTTDAGLELGAEFVHGDLPLTKQLVKEAGLSLKTTGGEWVELRGGREEAALDDKAWPLLMRKLEALEQDMSLEQFLELHFKDDKYAALKGQAISFAEGYDTADTTLVSAKALYEEWKEEADEQYRVAGGYGALMTFLAEKAQENGAEIRLSQAVERIQVTEDQVTVSIGNTELSAPKAIIAVPLGVLQAGNVLSIEGAAADKYLRSLDALGFGRVIKFVLEFREAFWEHSYPGLGFLLSGAQVPTWWTQYPEKSKVLTGWLGGRAAMNKAGFSNDQLQELALAALAQLFSINRATLEGLLSHSHIVNWNTDHYTQGSYAYTTVTASGALAHLRQPLLDRLHFAGEYMYEGPAIGTVEAAFSSAKECVSELLRTC